jgi:uncharacterized protein (TIGR02246 family)
MEIENQAISELLDAWRDAMRSGDANALASLVTEDAEFWTHGVAPLIGRQAILDTLTPVLTGYEVEQELDLQELVVSGDLAFMRGMEHNTMRAKDGSQTLERRQRAFSIMRRGADGKWRFSRGMTNLPPEE